MRDPGGNTVAISLPIEDALVEAARDRGVRPALVVGLAWKESSFQWWAGKHEPTYPYLWDVKANKPTRSEAVGSLGMVSQATELVFQRTSWGLLQVMGAVARELGFREVLLSHLLDARLSASYGAQLLANLLKRHNGDEADALSAYNAGSPTDANFASYVSPILKMATIYEREKGQP